MDFEIVKNVARGVERPINVQIDDSGGEDISLFKRRAIKGVGGPIENQRAVNWLVAELDGVRCYIDAEANGPVKIVLTKKDLYP